MVDFKYMMSDEYKQKRKIQKEQEAKLQQSIDSTCSFTGHRPNRLYGYNINKDKYIELGKVIRVECIRLIEDMNVDRFISGGALGLDTIAFLIVNKLKDKYPNIKNILTIPFKNQPIKWFNQVDINRYNKMKELADDIIYVDTLEKYKIEGYEENIYYPAKMQKRNKYMVDNSRYLISVWGGSKNGGTWNCIKYAKNHCNEITRINPNYLDVTYNLQCLL